MPSRLPWKTHVEDSRDEVRLRALGLLEPGPAFLPGLGTPATLSPTRDVRILDETAPSWFMKRFAFEGKTTLQRWKARLEAAREWTNLRRLRDSGVLVSRPVMAARGSLGAMIVTEDVGGIPVLAAFRSHPVSTLTEALAGLVASLDRADFVPKDLLAKHVHLAGSPPRAILFDVARGYWRRDFARRMGRSLGQLFSTLPAQPGMVMDPLVLARATRRDPAVLLEAALASFLEARASWSGLRARTPFPERELFVQVARGAFGAVADGVNPDTAAELLRGEPATWNGRVLDLDRRGIQRILDVAAQALRLGLDAPYPRAVAFFGQASERGRLLLPAQEGDGSGALEDIRPPHRLGSILAGLHAAGLLSEGMRTSDGSVAIRDWSAIPRVARPTPSVFSADLLRVEALLPLTARAEFGAAYAEAAKDPMEASLKEALSRAGRTR